MLATLLLMAALVSCASEDNAVDNGRTDNNNTGNTDGLTAFVAGTDDDNGSSKTRTSIDYGSGAFYWEEGDRIYVQDDEGTWQASTNSVRGTKASSYKFMLPGKFSASSTYTVYYPGKNGSNNQVTIPATQTQTAPTNITHIGASGDCGIGTATKGANGKFSFRIDHKPAILVFQPYTDNVALQNCHLTKIEVTSDNNLAGSYTLTPDPSGVTTGTLIGMGSTNQIILTTKGATGSSTANGFPMNTAVADPTVNGSYMVIAPGTYALTVRYWVKDIVTNVEAVFTKNYPSFNFAANGYYDMTASLNIERNYESDRYYMWDANHRHYWYGYESSQPTINGRSNNNYPKSGSDQRYWNQSGSVYNASKSATICPNINEMAWYAYRGNPCWDADELWTLMGHLYKGGMWFKKKENISGFRKDKAHNGADYRSSNTWNPISNVTPVHARPSSADIGQYFFLPASGFYRDGTLRSAGIAGLYWTSSTHTAWANVAYSMGISPTAIAISYNSRSIGAKVHAFE